MTDSERSFLLAELNAVEFKPNVWYAEESILLLSWKKIQMLASYSNDLNYRQFRLCLHRCNSEHMHMMLIIHNRPQTIFWHKQPSKSLVCYQCITGTLEVRTSISSAYKLNGSDQIRDHQFLTNNLLIALPRSQPRCITTLTQQSIFLETCDGPFEDSDTIWGYQ